MSFWVLLSCLSADSVPVNFISESPFSIRLRGKPLTCKRTLKFEMFSSKVTLEEFVRRHSCDVLRYVTRHTFLGVMNVTLNRAWYIPT